MFIEKQNVFEKFVQYWEENCIKFGFGRYPRFYFYVTDPELYTTISTEASKHLNFFYWIDYKHSDYMVNRTGSQLIVKFSREKFEILKPYRKY